MSEQKTPIQAGDYVRVPKGTRVWPIGYFKVCGRDEPTKRESVVKVTAVEGPLDKGQTGYNDWSRPENYWIGLLEYKDRSTAEQASRARDQEALAELKAKVQPILDAEGFVYWSTSYARLQDVERLPEEEQITRKEAEKTPKVRKATTVQLMVPKSTWKLTADLELSKRKNWSNDELLHVLTIRQGAEITVTGKKYDAYPNGLSVPVSIREEDITFRNDKVVRAPENGKLEIAIPVKRLEAIVEQVGEAVEQYWFVIRDSTTGKFYKTTTYGYFDFIENPEYRKWVQDQQAANPYPKYQPGNPAAWTKTYETYQRNLEAWEKANPKPRAGTYTPLPGAEPFEMVTKLSEAKKHTDIGKVKTTILNFSGYFNGMGDQQAGLEYWHQGDSNDYGESLPLPPTFECVKIGKFSKEVKETIDLQAWYRATWGLRDLTLKFGSSVRGVYKKLEKAGKLDQFSYVVTIRPDYCRNTEECPSTEQIKEVDAFIKEQLDKPTKDKDNFGMSVAVETLGEAMMLKLAYEGDGEVHVIDFDQMEEVVQEAAAAVAAQ